MSSGILTNGNSCFNGDPVDPDKERMLRVCGCENCEETATKEFSSGIFVNDACDNLDHQAEMQQLALSNDKASSS